MSASSLFLMAMMLCLLQIITAQVGPKIFNPPNNGTVDPGSKVPIQFAYQNMGTGDVAVNISLWQDARATEKIQDVVTNYQLPPNNSSGVQLVFAKNGTYDWWVPHGMNFTFYLTVTESTETQLGNFSLQSFPIMLHPSAAWAILPNFISVLVLIAGVIILQA